MKIYWGFRLMVDVGIIAVFTKYFCLNPTFFWRHKKMDGLRWARRRRQYIANPYFSKPETWLVKYDERFNPVF